MTEDLRIHAPRSGQAAAEYDSERRSTSLKRTGGQGLVM